MSTITHSSRIPQLRDPEWLARQLEIKSYKTIAGEIGCSTQTVHNAAVHMEINPDRDRGWKPENWEPPNKLNIEDFLGERFGMLVVLSEVEPYHKHGIQRVLTRCDCGNEKIIVLSSLNIQKNGWDHCGCLTAQRQSGQRQEFTVTGYRQIRVNGKGFAEHRWVMEQVIGRPLVPGENVHHLNGVRDDNRPENLELWNINQPAGQRAKDKVKHAREILALYGDMFPEDEDGIPADA